MTTVHQDGVLTRTLRPILSTSAISGTFNIHSPLADASSSCGVRSGQPGTDAHIEPQSVGGLCQAPHADLLPPVPLVARHLLLSHAQELAEFCLRKAASYARLGDEQTLVVLISVARLTIIPNTSTL
jgi:hypothetical protein